MLNQNLKKKKKTSYIVLYIYIYIYEMSLSYTCYNLTRVACFFKGKLQITILKFKDD